MKYAFIVLGVILVALLVFACLPIARDIPPQNASDLVPRKVTLPADQNAFTYFCAATNYLYEPTNYYAIIDPILGGKTNDDATAALYTEKNAEVFKQISKGLECAACQGPEVKSLSTLLPHVAKFRTIARMMALKAIHERNIGHFADATQTRIDIIRFGDMLQKDGQCIIGYLVGIAIVCIGAEKTEAFSQVKGLEEAELSAMHKSLAVVGPYHDGFANAVKGEYVIGCSAIDEIKSGTIGLSDLVSDFTVPSKSMRISSSQLPYIFHPERTKLMMADYYRGMIADTNKPLSLCQVSDSDLPGQCDRKFMMFIKPNVVGKILVNLMLPVLSAVHEKRCWMEYNVTSLRLLIAVKLYEKRRGVLPASLDELVPDYFPQMPRDSFDGKPMRYSQEKRLIWSVGKDLKDSGGSMLKHGVKPKYSKDANDYVTRID